MHKLLGGSFFLPRKFSKPNIHKTMKRLLSLSLVVASLFGFGLNANAASEPQQTTAVFASTSEYSKEQIIIYISNDPQTDTLLKSILSSFSYAQIPEDFLSLFSQGSVQPNQDITTTLQSGGTSGTGAVDNAGSSNGPGNGIETPQPTQTTSSTTQVTTQTIQTNQEPTQNVSLPTQLTTTAVQPTQTNAQPTLVAQQPITVATQPTPVVSQPVVVTLQPYNPTTLKITSLYPNTTGNDADEEFIALVNTGTKDVNLKDWSLKDTSGKTFTFETDFLLAPGLQTELKRAQTSITLNNDAEEISLFAPDDSLIDNVLYASAPKGEVYKWANGVWSWPPKVSTNEPETVQTVQTTATTTEQGPTTQSNISLPPVVSQPVAVTLQPSNPTTLKITSLYPNTTGNDAEEEFIAITNTGTENVNLKDWSLKDASGKTYMFDTELVLAPNAQTEVNRAQTNITLNDDAEEISLFAPDNSLIDNVKYADAPNGETYKWIDGVWGWPAETQTNEPETVQTTQTIAAETEPTNQSDPVTTVVNNFLTVSQAKNSPDQTIVKVSGVVSVLPGVLGKQFFYIQDDESGIQVYKYDALFPELKVGQKIIVNGEMSTNGSERRVKVTKTGTIEPTSEINILESKSAEIVGLKTDDVGELFTVTGILKSIAADKLQIEKDGLTLDIAIAVQSGIDTTTFVPGISLQATGIIRSTAGGVKLSPRSQDDLVVLSQPVNPLIAGTLDTGKSSQNKSDQNIALLLTASSSIVMIAFIVRHLIRKQKTIYATDHPIELTTENVH